MKSPVPVAGTVCGCSPAEIVGSNPTGGEWMSVVCFQLEIAVKS